MKNYKIFAWPGSGYALDGPFTYSASCEEQALELFAVDCIKNEWTEYYLTEEGYSKLCEDVGYNPDDHGGDDLEGWLYIDATMEGAPFPIYIGCENMRIETA